MILDYHSHYLAREHFNMHVRTPKGRIVGARTSGEGAVETAQALTCLMFGGVFEHFPHMGVEYIVLGSDFPFDMGVQDPDALFGANLSEDVRQQILAGSPDLLRRDESK